MINMVTFTCSIAHIGAKQIKMNAIKLKSGNPIKTIEDWNEMMKLLENENQHADSNSICVLNITPLEE